MLVLSLFPGIGLLDMAFELEGFCVVRGPDVLWGGDIRRFHPPAGKFDGVIGGPPCQAFSSLARLVRANGHQPKFGNLIPEFERCVAEIEPAWFLMENVPAAPKPVIEGYGSKPFLLDNSRLAGEGVFGLEQKRVRRITFGMRGRSDDEVPSLMRWIELAVFLLRDAKGNETVTRSTFDNTVDHHKTRVSPIAAGHMNPDALTARKRTRKVTVTSTDGGGRPSEKLTRKNAVLAATSANPGCTGATKSSKAKLRRVEAITSSKGGTGKMRTDVMRPDNGKGRYRLPEACRLQGLPEDFLSDAPFTAEGKLKAVANGVPLPMGRALARAVREAVGPLTTDNGQLTR
jgi:site-specific DNA-cytosine methylase